ncbi:MAG: cation diffusion facilitator family transporter [Burkholderiales bacterium]|jgi:cation diffusion facilitator family transporter|nr:cation diffusion facilitator family transporter [Burkholderiales bacterium]
MSPAADTISTTDRHAAATRSTLVSVSVNFTLSTAQIIIGFFAHSQSLIADGFHTLTDLFADFVVLGANRISRKKADDNHPYGHARFENAASMILGILLIIAGLGMLLAAARKFTAPDLIPRVHQIALYAALVVIVAKELLFRYMIRVAKRVNSSMLIANAWHARSDAASSVVVALGITGNLVGYTFFDPLAAALVGFLICRTGGKFVWDALARLTDRGLSSEELAAVKTTLEETPGVIGVHDLRTRFMGDDVLIDAHLLVDNTLTVSEGHLIAANARKRALARHNALDVLAHIDSEDDSGGDAFPDLPDRGAIIAVIGDLYQDLNLDIHIHYLRDQIEIELIVKKKRLADRDNRQKITAAIARLKHELPMLRRVRLLADMDDDVLERFD